MENEGPIQTVEYFSTRKFYAHGRFMSLISKGADRAVVILPEAFSACWKDIALKIGNFINYSPPRKSKAPHRMVDTNNSYAKVVENRNFGKILTLRCLPSPRLGNGDHQLWKKVFGVNIYEMIENTFLIEFPNRNMAEQILHGGWTWKKSRVEPIRNFFAALFLSSIGMLIHVHFLWNHIDILLAAVILVVIIKTIVVAAVVKGFGYTNKAALLEFGLTRVIKEIKWRIPQWPLGRRVGMSLAQIGEFAFVLLSRASNVHLIEGKVYMLLLGTTALSLILTKSVLVVGIYVKWVLGIASPNILHFLSV
uniref:Cation/H+ exchanger transmembrane domain-containing protein n=1 Tax=Solanum lycopersicum TaxID=4081 RepID=A0A3Q7HCH7_SOLLC